MQIRSFRLLLALLDVLGEVGPRLDRLLKLDQGLRHRLLERTP